LGFKNRLYIVGADIGKAGIVELHNNAVATGFQAKGAFQFHLIREAMGLNQRLQFWQHIVHAELVTGGPHAEKQIFFLGSH
jgi:hypothetical protein